MKILNLLTINSQGFSHAKKVILILAKKALFSSAMVRMLFAFFVLASLFAQAVMGQSLQKQPWDVEEIMISEKNQSQFKKPYSNALTNTYDVKYYRLDLTVNPSIRFITGNVTIYFVPNQNLSQIVFDLSNSLVVDSVKSSSQGAFSHAQDAIAYNQNFTANVLDSVTIYYHGVPNPSSTAFVQDEHDGTPIIWTLSEPYGVMEWWPCKQSLTDKADSIDMFVTAPAKYKVAGNGSLVSEIISDTLETTHWKNRYPIVPYLVAFAVTDYAEISFNTSLSTGTLFVQNYVYKEDSAFVLQDLFGTDTLLRLFDSLVGAYPFMNEKYGHAQFSRGGGMEHQTMSFMYHFGFGLNAHELAHQWFGDKITCGSWSDLWLNEGFATYFTGLAYENLKGDSLWMEWKKSTLSSILSQPNGSVYVIDTANVGRLFDSRLTYRKGAYVLHMLRYEMGNDVLFFQGIRNYLEDSNLAYKTALTDDFFNHMEAVSGFDYSWFKNEWVYGEGYPSYNLQWEQVGANLEYTLSQTTSNPSVSFYHNRVPVLVTNSKGDSALFDVIPAEPDFVFSTNVGFEVETVIIDPNLELISKGNFTINVNRISDFMIYPNPVSNELVITPGNNLGILKSYQVYSSNGKLVMSDDNFNQFQNSTIDVSKLPHGVYTLVFQVSSQDVIKKFVVSR